MRKTWRLQGRSETLIIMCRSDVTKNEKATVAPASVVMNLGRWLEDPFSRKAVLDMYESVGGYPVRPGRTSQQELTRTVKPHLEKAIQRGDLVAVPMPPIFSLKGLQLLEEAKPARIVSPSRRTERQKAWLRFQIVEDKTGKPIKGLKLKITLPDGSEATKETQADGAVEIRDVNPGLFSMTAAVKPAQMDHSLHFVGMGENRSSGGQPVEKESSEKFIDGSDMSVAVFVAHRVKTGETLESIAQLYGYSADDLARFNWGTTDTEEINDHLRDNVGCTKKTSDGRNYELSSSDEPGIIYVPKPWKQSGLTTERTHTVRVKQKRVFLVILENEKQLRIPEVRYEVKLSDGSKRMGRLGKSGVSLIEDPPSGEVEIEYLDFDDIEAKSLAVCVRKAFDDRDTEDIFRLLGHSPQMIQMVISAYDKYYNDYTGRGLIEDIYQEITDPVALMAVEGGLVRAGVPTHGEFHYVV